MGFRVLQELYTVGFGVRDCSGRGSLLLTFHEKRDPRPKLLFLFAFAPEGQNKRRRGPRRKWTLDGIATIFTGGPPLNPKP